MLVKNITIQDNKLNIQLFENGKTLEVVVNIDLDNLEETRKEFKKAIKAISEEIRVLKNRERALDFYRTKARKH